MIDTEQAVLGDGGIYRTSAVGDLSGVIRVMRKIASIKQPKDDAKRVMLFDSGEGVYLFLYSSERDGASTGDFWFQTVEQAEKSCLDEYGITPSDWQMIPDPLPGCQHDWVQPHAN